ncbi:MAG TPA: porin [Myxococcota bacterium]|nr:porin [Myxococcota bacterium]
MKHSSRIALILAGICSQAPSIAQAAEVLRTEHADLDVNGRFQLLGQGEHVPSAFRDTNRMYLFLNQARLSLSGRYDEITFRLELGMGGEATLKAPNPGVSLGLLDMYVDLPLHALGSTRLRVGQFKVPYSRERLAYSANLPFALRSIQDLGFRMGRDVGATLHTYVGEGVVAFGVFTGGGRDVPQRYLPETLGFPMLVARIGLNHGYDDDVFAAHYRLAHPDHTTGAVFVNGFYTRDTIIGHSSVLNVRLEENSLLTDAGWNPYLASTPMTHGQLWQVGGDAVVETPMGDGALSVEGEVNYGGFDNTAGSLRLFGGRLQGGYRTDCWGVALRYAMLLPDKRFAVGATPITGSGAMQEVTPALTFFLNEHAKVILDLPLLFGSPVVTEPKIGSYVLADMPGQTSVLKNGGSVARETVVQGRILFQATF